VPSLKIFIVRILDIVQRRLYSAILAALRAGARSGVDPKSEMLGY